MGRFAGIFVLFNSLAFLIGYLIVGPLADLIGIIPLFLSSASIAIIAISSILVFSKAKTLEQLTIESSPRTSVGEEIPSIKDGDKDEQVKSPA